MRWLDGITDSMGMSLSEVWEIVKGKKAWRVTVHGVTESQRTEQQQQRTKGRRSRWLPW